MGSDSPTMKPQWAQEMEQRKQAITIAPLLLRAMRGTGTTQSQSGKYRASIMRRLGSTTDNDAESLRSPPFCVRSRVLLAPFESRLNSTTLTSSAKRAFCACDFQVDSADDEDDEDDDDDDEDDDEDDKGRSVVLFARRAQPHKVVAGAGEEEGEAAVEAAAAAEEDDASDVVEGVSIDLDAFRFPSDARNQSDMEERPWRRLPIYDRSAEHPFLFCWFQLRNLMIKTCESHGICGPRSTAA